MIYHLSLIFLYFPDFDYFIYWCSHTFSFVGYDSNKHEEQYVTLVREQILCMWPACQGCLKLGVEGLRAIPQVMMHVIQWLQNI